MKVVVDTNVVAYYVLGTEPFVSEVRSFWSEIREPLAPAHWEAELANVVWLTVRAGLLSAGDAVIRLVSATSLNIYSVPTHTLWSGALTISLDSGLAIYDSLFVELAVRERLKLATYDRKILTAFPEIAKRTGELLPKGLNPPE